MIFNSVTFLLFFLPITLVVFYVAPKALRSLVIALASALFYSFSSNWNNDAISYPFLFMIFCIVWAYGASYLVDYLSKGLSLFIAIVFPASTLYLFRYLGFTLDVFGAQDTAGHFGIFLDVVLPAGISFYTFQIMSYSIDLCDKRIKREDNFIDFFAYISFFPQLIAGPILRYEELFVQIKKLKTGLPNEVDWEKCIRYLVVGLFFKIYIGDRFAVLNDVVSSSSSSIDILHLIFSYSFRIYIDFWSYSIMAIGIAGMFGISLPKNFLEPYKSLNPREFWRRWHVTLSYWLRDYVYIKLGGNNNYIRNIIIVFTAVGIWHGAGYNFIIWGIVHAGLVVGYSLVAPVWDKWPRYLQVAITFTLVSLAWPLFMFDLNEYGLIMARLFSPDAMAAGSVFSIFHWIFLALIGIFLFLFQEKDWLDTPKSFFRYLHQPEIHALVLFMCLIGTNWSRTFIYFRF